MVKIMFVCHGNICTWAATILRRKNEVCTFFAPFCLPNLRGKVKEQGWQIVDDGNLSDQVLDDNQQLIKVNHLISLI